MTVPTEACDASFPFTGAENTFNTAFRAKAESHVKAKFTDGDGAVTVLVNPTHFTVALDPTSEVATVTRVLFPAAAGTLYVWRDTPAIQDVEFADLEDFPGDTHTDVADVGAMRDAELRRDQAAILAAAEDLTEAVTQAEAAANVAAGHAASASADKDQTALDVIATAADRVQTGLDVIAAAASAALAAANSENPAFTYLWDDDTTASEPASSYVKGDNAALASIGTILISETALEGAIGGFISAMVASASAVKATVVLLRLDAPTNWVALDVTAHADNGVTRELTCDNLGGGGSFTAGDEIGFFIQRAGPPGSGLANVVDDLTPQAGGTFDMNAKQMRFSKGADVASANALTLGDDGNYFDITGTTAITSIGTKAVGTIVKLHFDGILTLTHHAADLILPGGANITTAAGDEAEFVEYAAGDWRCVNYSRAAGPVDVAAKTQDWEASGIFVSPADGDYILKLKLKRGVTITDVTTKCGSGSCTATFKIDGVALGGTANAVTTSEQSQAHASANVAAAGTDISMTISANSGCQKLSFTMSGTQVLA